MLLAGLVSMVIAGASCPTQDTVLLQAADAIEERYVMAPQAQDIGRHLREAAASDHYASTCADPKAFVERLNRDLDVFDGHFLVERERTDDAGAGPPDWLSAWRASAREVNAGIREVRVLEGNVGYLRIASWYPLDTAGPKLTAAWALLSDIDGLIIDLRGNGGGDAATASHLVRALLPAGTPSVQSIERRGGRTDDPLPDAGFPYVRADMPVVILIDRRSASASEFVAYTLQAEGRATVVGSRSAGVAHIIGDPVPLSSGYAIAIPDARPLNRITGRNWEGVGVTPQVSGGDDPLHIGRRQIESMRTP